MANVNNTKISYIFSTLGSNIFPDFSFMSQCNKVIYVTNIAYKARFALLAGVFIA